MKTFINTIILTLALFVGVAFASSGWQSDYDVRWDITVADQCAGSVVVYHNCYITDQGQDHISFIADQGKTGITTGRVRTVIKTNCVSVSLEEVD